MRTRRFLFSALFMALLVAPFMSPGLGSTGDLKTLIVASPAWEGYTHEDGSGLYFELLRKIYQPRGIAVETLIVPWKRAKAKILNDQADCMPAAYLTPEDDRWTYPGYPMDVDYTAAVFLRRKVEAWDGLKTLAGKSVVWPRGYNFQNYLDVNVD